VARLLQTLVPTDQILYLVALLQQAAVMEHHLMLKTVMLAVLAVALVMLELRELELQVKAMLAEQVS
jgi:hypothetical protein